jgi:hypothetical protein
VDFKEMGCGHGLQHVCGIITFQKFLISLFVTRPHTAHPYKPAELIIIIIIIIMLSTTWAS